MHVRIDFRETDPALDALEARWMQTWEAGGPDAEAAFDGLFQAYDPLFVRRLQKKHEINPAEAEQVAQEAWMGVLRNIGRYPKEAPVRLYLFSFLEMAKLRFKSRESSRPRHESDSNEAVAAAIENSVLLLQLSPGNDPALRDFLRCVRNAFLRFETEQPHLAQLLLLRHVEELSLEEMAEEVGKTAAALKAVVYTARQRFKPMAQACQIFWLSPTAVQAR